MASQVRRLHQILRLRCGERYTSLVYMFHTRSFTRLISIVVKTVTNQTRTETTVEKRKLAVKTVKNITSIDRHEVC